jgi:hypothetical protein
MSSWYKATFSKGEHASKGGQLQTAFERLFLDAFAPRDAAMFTTEGPETPDRRPYSYFFSPGAVHVARTLIEAYGGRPCDAPPRKGLTLLVGHDDSEEIPFAG